MKLLNIIRHFIWTNIFVVFLSIPAVFLIILGSSLLKLCYMSDYCFAPVAILWPWGISKLSKKELKIPSVILSTLLGCILAYYIIGDSFYPECHRLAYQQTYKPLILVIGLGICSMTICLLYEKHKYISN